MIDRKLKQLSRWLRYRTGGERLPSWIGYIEFTNIGGAVYAQCIDRVMDTVQPRTAESFIVRLHLSGEHILGT